MNIYKLVLLALLIGCSNAPQNQYEKADSTTSNENSTEISTQTSHGAKAPKLTAFRNVEFVRGKILSMTYGEGLSNWKKMNDTTYSSITPYHEYQGPDSFRYYLESKNPSFIEKMGIVVKVNSGNKRLGVDLIVAASGIYRQLGIPIPDAIRNGFVKIQSAEVVTDSCMYRFTVEHTPISIYKLILESK